MFLSRAAVPKHAKFVFGIKLSSAKLEPFGVKFYEFVQIAKRVDSSDGFDYIELAGGNFEHPYVKDAEREELFRKLVLELKKHLRKVPLYATGGFRSVKIMEKMLREGKLDGIGVARPAAAEFGGLLKCEMTHNQ